MHPLNVSAILFALGLLLFGLGLWRLERREAMPRPLVAFTGATAAWAILALVLILSPGRADADFPIGVVGSNGKVAVVDGYDVRHLPGEVLVESRTGEAFGSELAPIAHLRGSVPSSEIIYRFLDTVGDGSGSIEQAVDGSSTPVKFKACPPSDEVWALGSMAVYAQDGGKFDTGAYGDAITITNGFELEVELSDGTQVLDLLAGHPIVTNPDWSAHACDVRLSNFGTGDETMEVIWCFNRVGVPLQVDGRADECLVMTVNDNVTALTSQHLKLQGRVWTTP